MRKASQVSSQMPVLSWSPLAARTMAQMLDQLPRQEARESSAILRPDTVHVCHMNAVSRALQPMQL